MSLLATGYVVRTLGSGHLQGDRIDRPTLFLLTLSAKCSELGLNSLVGLPLEQQQRLRVATIREKIRGLNLGVNGNALQPGVGMAVPAHRFEPQWPLERQPCQHRHGLAQVFPDKGYGTRPATVTR